MRDVAKSLRNVLVDILPLFTGLLVVTAQHPPGNFSYFFTQYLLTVICFLFWSSYCQLFPVLVPTSDEPTVQSTFKIITALIGIIIFGVLVALLHNHASVLSYQLSLFVLILLTLSYRFIGREDRNRAQLALLAYFFGAGILSYTFTNSLSWQAACFSLSVGTALALLKAELHSINPDEIPFMLTATSGILLLVFLNDLPNGYLVVLSALLIPLRFPRAKGLAPLLFLAILFGLSFI